MLCQSFKAVGCMVLLQPQIHTHIIPHTHKRPVELSLGNTNFLAVFENNVFFTTCQTFLYNSYYVLRLIPSIYECILIFF